MPDLLLELRSEEIPARMQRKAAGDLKKLVTDGLVDAGLTYEAAREYWTPRRLTLDIRGVTARSADIREERKGPRTDAPEKAIAGFLRGAGLESADQAEIRSDPKKGDFYVAVIEKPGRSAEDIIAETIPGIIREFPWPKSMRWGVESAKPGSLRWVRPLQSIVCTFGPETEEPVIVDFEIGGIRSGNVTYGHRFHAPDPITVRRFDDYAASLEKAKVVLDAERRKEIILADAKNLAFAAGLELVEDDGLLEEVSGLVEWPVVLMGEFDESFLAIPDEITRLTIKTNQKCFVTSRPSTSPLWGGRTEGSGRGQPPQAAGKETNTPTPNPSPQGGGELMRLSNKFIPISNIEATDGGAEIARGNGKVVAARLSDALYFWQTDQADLPDLDDLKASAEKFDLDLSKPLDQRMARLDHLGVTFHAKLGTQGGRVLRIAALAEELAPVVGADPKLARRSANLAKADLTTEAVGEFPELQGVMGRKYALLQGENESVAAAIEEHYKPQGPSDEVPSDPVSVAVALADKLDTLVGFWAIDEKPTGSKDPYALRRAALGVIRIVLENGVRLSVLSAIEKPIVTLPEDIVRSGGKAADAIHKVHSATEFDERDFVYNPALAIGYSLLSFFHDRLKVYLRDQGARHDLIDAVLAGGTAAPTSPLWGGRTEGSSGGQPPQAAGKETNTPTPDPSPQGGGESGGVTNDDLLMIVRRVEALGAFLESEDGTNLLAGTKRAANILAAEEKKNTVIADTVDPSLFTEKAEKALHEAVNQAESEAAQAIQNEDFSGAMTALAALREPVDSFFEDVHVMHEDSKVAANRLALLARIRNATDQVADFSKISG